MNERQYYEIRPADVGRDHVKAFGRVWPASGFIGQILPMDVGKRCYDFGHYIAVENNEQLEKRRANVKVQKGGGK